MTTEVTVGSRHLPSGLQDHPRPEEVRDAKDWLPQRMGDAVSYSETIDQAGLSAVLDLNEARRRSPSFNKLVRCVGELLLDDPGADDLRRPNLTP